MRTQKRITCMVGLFAMAGMAGAAEVYNVAATGEGATVPEARTQALATALRGVIDKMNPDKALETKENWSRMLLGANPEFVIQPKYYKVVSVTRPEDNTIKGRARVVVQVSLPASRLAELRQQQESLLKDMGQPTIMVLVSDRLEDRRPGYPRITIREDSDVAQALKERLQAAHFRVIVKRQAEVLRRDKADMATLRGDDLLAVQAEARKHLAQIFVWGEGRAVGPLADTASVSDRSRSIWSADAKCEAYWTDDASLIATEHANARMGDFDPDHGHVQAFQVVGKMVADQLVAGIFDAFGKQASEGRPVTIEVFNGSCDEGDAIGDALKDMLGEESVLDVQCDNGLVEIRILSKLRADALRRQLRGHTFDGFRIESNDSKKNSMQFKCVH